MSSSPGEIEALLVTRPEPEATETADLLQKALPSKCIYTAPLSEIRATGAKLPSRESFDRLLLTSPRAAPFARRYQGAPVLSVGKGTAEAARRDGLAPVTEGPGSIDTGLSASFRHGERLLHLCGLHLSQPLDEFAAAAGTSYMRIAVYGNRLVRTAPPALAPFLDHGGGKAALFMSARAVEAFAELTEGRSLHDVAAVCLSPRIAEEAAALSRFAGVLVSPEPTAQGFVDFVSGRCT